ncbi:hypothetical protein [Pseudomonas asiatica]|uniref:hypothetical protein n=1 Tax=Pseudomonas asiatica TaxID=2219225 RepID=UPI0025AB251C|nr:hypothetical protein [Pseudomonas asiatica]MDM9591635.1 hypothetical protein [Pseudomonas asiatica]
MVSKLHPSQHLHQAALAAVRRYHEAKDYGCVPQELERLRLEAQAAFKAITDYRSRQSFASESCTLPPLSPMAKKIGD